MIKICPECKKESYIEIPHGRIYKTSLFGDYYSHSEYYWKCHNEKCGHKSEIFKEVETTNKKKNKKKNRFWRNIWLIL